MKRRGAPFSNVPIQGGMKSEREHRVCWEDNQDYRGNRNSLIGNCWSQHNLDLGLSRNRTDCDWHRWMLPNLRLVRNFNLHYLQAMQLERPSHLLWWSSESQACLHCYRLPITLIRDQGNMAAFNDADMFAEKIGFKICPLKNESWDRDCNH